MNHHHHNHRPLRSRLARQAARVYLGEGLDRGDSPSSVSKSGLAQLTVWHRLSVGLVFLIGLALGLALGAS